jgi:hypothetical protein
MSDYLTQICTRCGEEFRSKRRRAHCGDVCYERSRAIIRAKLVDPAKLTDPRMQAVKASYRFDADHDAKCERDTQSRVLAWYEARYRERVAEGVKPHIPFEAVKIAVLAGVAAFVPGRVIRCLAVSEDIQEQGSAIKTSRSDADN